MTGGGHLRVVPQVDPALARAHAQLDQLDGNVREVLARMAGLLAEVAGSVTLEQAAFVEGAVAALDAVRSGSLELPPFFDTPGAGGDEGGGDPPPEPAA